MDPYKVWVCSNVETLADGWTAGDGAASFPAEVAAAGEGAALDVLAEARRRGAPLDYTTDGYFQHWHGGKHYQAGGPYGGYSAGQVTCLARHVPQWLRKVIDRAQRAMDRARKKAHTDNVAASIAQERDEANRLAVSAGAVLVGRYGRHGYAELAAVAPDGQQWTNGDTEIVASWALGDADNQLAALVKLVAALESEDLEPVGTDA